MKLLIIIALVIASKCTVFHEHIQTRIHNVPGITGTLQADCYNQKVGTLTYTITAASESRNPVYYRIDALPWYHAVRADSGVTFNGELITVPPHDAGMTFTIVLDDGPCSCGAPDIKYESKTYLPYLLSEVP